MRAIVLEKFGGLNSLVYKDIPEPEAGHVVIEIKAFGLSRLLQEKRT
jgi:NADPH2:quinone reductase